MSCAASPATRWKTNHPRNSPLASRGPSARPCTIQTRYATRLPRSPNGQPPNYARRVRSAAPCKCSPPPTVSNPAAPRHSASGSTGFATPIADSRPIVAAASRIFEDIRREGVAYRKAGVLLLDLSSENSVAPTLFPEAPDDHLMRAVDTINARHGRGAVGLGLAATGATWRMRQQHRSPRFTTRWQELATARL